MLSFLPWLKFCLFTLLLNYPFIQPELLLGDNLVQTPSLVTQEIRYRLPEAGEIYLVWAVNSGRMTPEDIRPVSQILRKDGTTLKLMARQGDIFVTRVQAPTGTTIIYGFWITNHLDGVEIEPIWDGRTNYQEHLVEDKIIEIETNLNEIQQAQVSEKPTVVNPPIQVENNPIEVKATVKLTWPTAIPKPTATAKNKLVTQELHLSVPKAGEVLLVWGINGWQAAPEEFRPPGTIIPNKTMRTPMLREGDIFSIKLQLPVGTTIDYGFLITKNHRGEDIENIWVADGTQDYKTIVTWDNVLEIKKTVTISSEDKDKVSTNRSNAQQESGAEGVASSQTPAPGDTLFFYIGWLWPGLSLAGITLILSLVLIRKKQARSRLTE